MTTATQLPYLPDKVERERFAERRQDELSMLEWLNAFAQSHDHMPARQEVKIDGDAIADALDLERLKLCEDINKSFKLLKVTTRSTKWTETAKIGKVPIDEWLVDQCGEDTRGKGRNLAEVISAQNKMRAGKGYVVVITTEPQAFLRLGCNKCDNRSCFKGGGQFELAPLVLGENRNTFIGYIKDGEKVCGRCWGQYHQGIDHDHTSWYITNFYQRSLPYDNCAQCAKQIFTLAMQSLFGELPTHRPSIAKPSTVYLNGDAIGSGSIERWEVNTLTDFGTCSSCCHCGNTVDEEGTVVDGDPVCEDCLHENYSLMGDEWVHTNHLTYAEYEEEYIWTEDAVLLIDDTYTHEDNAVQLQAGENEGEYMHCNDDALATTDCCGKYYNAEGGLPC